MRLSGCSVPLEAQEASWLAASAGIVSLRCPYTIRIPLISLVKSKATDPD